MRALLTATVLLVALQGVGVVSAQPTPANGEADASLAELSEDELVSMFFRKVDVPLQQVEEELLGRGRAAVPPLIESLVDRGTSGGVPDLLAKLHEHSAEPLVEALLVADDFDTRRAIRLVLFQIKEDEATVLTTALDRADEPARQVIAEVLSETGKPACLGIDALVRALDSTNPKTREDILVTIGKCGPRAERAVDAIIKILVGEDDHLAGKAIDALAELGPHASAALPVLRAGLGGGIRQPEGDIVWVIEEIESGERLTIEEFDREMAREKASLEIEERYRENTRRAGHTFQSALAGFRIADAPLWKTLAKGLGTRENLPALRKALASNEPRIRLGAASAISYIPWEDRGVASILIEGLHSTDPDVRLSIMETLSRSAHLLPTDSVPTLVRLVETARDRETRDAALSLVLSVRPSHPVAIPLLEEALSATYYWERAMATRTIASLGPRGVPYIERIATLTNDPNDDVRKSAMSALGELVTSAHSEEAAGVLVFALQEGDVEARRAAATALQDAELSEVSAAVESALISALISALQDSDDGVVHSSLGALSKLGLERRVTAEAVYDLYASRRENVWTGAGNVLLEHERFDLLGRALSEPSHRLRGDAVKLLARKLRGSRWERRRALLSAAGLDSRAQLENIRPLLRESDVWVREATLRMLGEARLTWPALVDEICALLGDDDERVRRAATDAIISLGTLAHLPAARHLESGNIQIRLGVLRAFDQVRKIESMPLYRVSARLGDPSIEVALTAVKVLRRNSPLGSNFFVRSLSDPNPRARRLAAWGLQTQGLTDDVIAALEKSLSDGDAEVRRAAADSLGFAGTAASGARPTLRNLLSDSDLQVRLAAGRALRRIDAFGMGTLVEALKDDRTCGGAAEALGSLYKRGSAAAIDLDLSANQAVAEHRGAIETARWRVGMNVRHRLEVKPPVFRSWNAPMSEGSWRVDAEIVVLPNGEVDLVRLVRGDAEEVNTSVVGALRRAVFEPARDAEGKPVAVYLRVTVEPGAEAPAFGRQR